MTKSNFFKTNRATLLAGTALASMIGVTFAPTSALAGCVGVDTVVCTTTVAPIVPPYLQVSGGNPQSLTFTGVTITSANPIFTVGLGDGGNGVNLTYIETGAPSTITNTNGGAALLVQTTGAAGDISITTIAGSLASSPSVPLFGIGIIADVDNPASTGNITANLGGNVVAGGFGVWAINAGSGSISVTNTGNIGFDGANVSPTGSFGIFAESAGTPTAASPNLGAITINNGNTAGSAGTIASLGDGVVANAGGGGNVVVNNNAKSAITAGLAADGKTEAAKGMG